MRRFLHLLEQRPTVSFMVILLLLFGLISLAATSRLPQESTEEQPKDPKTSTIFSPTESGFALVTAKTKKSGVVDIVALTSGTVQSIHVVPGQPVNRGTSLLTLTNDYGTNTAQYTKAKLTLAKDFTDRVFALEKEINEREKKIARSNDELTRREEKNTLARLRIDLERLRLNRETASLDAAIANASDAILRPKSIVSGTVEFVGVRVGETVNAGMLLATLRGSQGVTTLSASLPDHIAQAIDPRGIGTLTLNGQSTPLTQGYLSQSENTFGLRSITFPVTTELAAALTEGEYVNIMLPLINRDHHIFIPLDAVLSGANGSSVLIRNAEGKAEERSVTLGETIGSFIAVTDGVNLSDEILLNRGIFPGEVVTIVQ